MLLLISFNQRIGDTPIHQDSGSAYDEWLKMGAPDILSEADLAYLNAVSVPKIKKKYQTICTCIEVRRTLHPHEVVLIEISPKNPTKIPQT